MPQLVLAGRQTLTLAPDVSIENILSDGGLISITATAHGLDSGALVSISGVLGTLEAAGIFSITKTDNDTFTLDGSHFVTAYDSGGNCKHLGAVIGPVTTDNSVFDVLKPVDFTLSATLHDLSPAAGVRVEFQDTGDSAFVFAQPLAVLSAIAPVAGNAFEPRALRTIRRADVPDIRMGSAGNALRVRVFLSGGAYTSCKLSCALSW